MSEETSLEVQGAGLRAKLSGISGDHILHFVIIIMLGALIWKMFVIDKERVLQFAAVLQSLAENSTQNKTILLNQAKIIELNHTTADQQEGTNYILTLSDKERKELKLTMPSNLRKQQNSR